MVLTIVATLQVKEGSADQMAESLRGVQKEYLTHPGCLNWYIMKNTKKPLEFVIVERYEDQAAIQYHVASQTYKDYVKATGPIVTGKDVQIHEEIDGASAKL